jgi:hypothetical protein
MDAFGREWALIDQALMFNPVLLGSDTPLPQPGFIICEITFRGRDDSKREIAEITTKRPLLMSATDGTTSFIVFYDQLTQEPVEELGY